MKIKKNCGTKKILLALAAGLSLSLTGCGMFNGNNSSDDLFFSSGNSQRYYDSAKADSSNLTKKDNSFSAYNGKNTLEVRVPVEVGKEVLYACMITNPNYSYISKLSLTPPLVYNARASYEKNTNADLRVPSLSSNFLGFREGSAKLQLQKKVLEMYENQRISGIRASIRASLPHNDEFVGQKGVPVTIIGEKRTCTLARISEHCKIFIDEEKYKSIEKCDIPSEKLDEFTYEFENYIYPVMKENFGDGREIFWNDVDNDGRLSIVFSPVVNFYQSNGDSPGEVVGIFDTSSMNCSNPRDMISLGAKVNDALFDKWFMDARETIAHEMQHIVNFSAKGGNTSERQLWIDEGLSVCAEILYRKKRAENHLNTYSVYYKGFCEDFAGNDARFYYYAFNFPDIPVKSFSSNDNYTLAHYGQKGLFFYYIYEQYGKDAINRLCRGSSGLDKFNNLGSDGRSLEQLIIDFNFAVLYEKLRNVDFSGKFDKNPYFSANANSSRYRFSANMNLNFVYVAKNSPYEKTTADMLLSRLPNILTRKTLPLISDSVDYLQGNGGTYRFFFLQPKDISSAISGESSYRLIFDSNQPIVVNMIRMTD